MSAKKVTLRPFNGCEEASPRSRDSYIQCHGPIHALIDNGDSRMYWMCLPCADHNVRNRGAKLIALAEAN